MNTEIMTTRANHHIDPHLHVWGWEIPVYLFLGGLVAGILVLLALRELTGRERPATPALRIMPFLALALLGLGMFALFLDLELKAHVYRFYLAFQPGSPMSWGSWILILVVPAAFLLGLGSLSFGQRLWLRRRLRPAPLERISRALTVLARRRRRVVLWSSLVGGVALGIYTGVLLGSLAARPLWNSAVLGPLFLVSGLSTAAALLLLFGPRESDQRALLRFDVAAIVVELVLIALFLIDLASGPATAREAVGLVLGGPFTAPFWALVVGGGLLVPLFMDLAEIRRGLAPTVVSAVLVLVGGFSLRFILTAAGQATGFDVP